MQELASIAAVMTGNKPAGGNKSASVGKSMHFTIHDGPHTCNTRAILCPVEYPIYHASHVFPATVFIVMATGHIVKNSDKCWIGWS